MSTDTETGTSRLAPVQPPAGRAGRPAPIGGRAAVQIPMPVHVARAYPRDVDAARRQMLEACERLEFAEDAFYEYSTSDGTTQRLTVVAACEIAQLWGNVTYGTNVLNRDDVYGESEVEAYAWDLQTNARASQEFTAPHIRENGRGAYRVTDSREILGVTADQGARRMRSCILRVLPHWYVLAAEEALMATLMRSVTVGDEPLDKTIRTQAAAFMKAWNVDRGQLERKIGRPLERWTHRDLVNLKILSKTLARGEVRVEDAFEARLVTAGELPEPRRPRASAPGEPAEHTDHPAGAFNPDCPACRDSVDTDDAPEWA